ncbi:zinc finger CONSTANS-LIKE 4-like [Olea europaea subsp. europaea]|uniref:Zinc finger CONSTANS-LIKE 4-like n=1 Tax=Olea europaea subsp. europaea TaxID=158383 RepID=A0A8S0RNA1_OLEEU|nr:zinc finger CONSTANS-LIKE 4-like [Olea europaea subsp. europaea]
MKRCVLCKGMARMYCESDQASLCWDCDAKVHSANFLVARHSRNLLCHVCQSPMPWSASGAKLAPTVSVCDKCVTTEEEEEEEDDESNVENEDETEDEDLEEEENQVVPWSSASPPPVSSSSSEGSIIGEREVRTKRMRDEISNDDQGCSSSQPHVHTAPFATAVMITKGVEPLPAPTKIRKTVVDRTDRVGFSESHILETLRRFHREEMVSGAGATEFCRGTRAVDYDSCDSY